MVEGFRRDGFTVAEIAGANRWAEALERQRLAIMASGCADRPWLFWECHNPFSRASVNLDSWALLDLCQAPAIVERLQALIGRDIVLFDSQITPNPALAEFDRPTWRNDEQFFPLDGSGGIVVRFPFGSGTARRFEYRRSKPAAIEYSVGQVLMHAADFDYRSDAVTDTGFCEYVVRYFPANRRYSRDPEHPVHRRLTERYPWINYAKMPLWLVSGEDRAGNDFATGFHTRTGRWTTARPR